jgi:hypothetical protein
MNQHSLIFVSYIPTEQKNHPSVQFALEIFYRNNLPCIFFDNGKDTWIDVLHNVINPPPRIPNQRNLEKDTREYILSGHRKHEYLERAIRENPEITHFMWIDINMFYDIWRTNIDSVGEYLKWMQKSISSWSPTILAFPGSWRKESVGSVEDLVDRVCWRFCGGLFMGDRKSLLEWLHQYKFYMTKMMCEEHALTWDFNMWALIEPHLTPNMLTWYYANNDESMLYIPPDLYTPKLPAAQTIVLNEHLPQINGYHSTSTSHVFYEGEHWTNTRYVSYSMLPNGYYTFSNLPGMRPNYIYNKNVLSKLMGNIPKESRVVAETALQHLQLPESSSFISYGLEDLRLFVSWNGDLKYIATTCGYSRSGRPSIIVGEYSVRDSAILSGCVVSPPTPTHCEKNWIPVPGHMEDLFLYRWWPTLQYGGLRDNSLEIRVEYPMTNPIFRNVRGSTVFIPEGEEYLLGVVHFSVETVPRHYYHMLVRLRSSSLELDSYTTPFIFGDHHGIEFCIGLWYTKCEYKFWVSFHDRDPKLLTVDAKSFLWITK